MDCDEIKKRYKKLKRKNEQLKKDFELLKKLDKEKMELLQKWAPFIHELKTTFSD